jgi:uncharacterized protein YjbJ (UPF0337 family)
LQRAAGNSGRSLPWASTKANNKGEEVKGSVKETVGKATGNEQLEAEGKGDKVAGNLKQAGEKVKDAFKK